MKFLLTLFILFVACSIFSWQLVAGIWAIGFIAIPIMLFFEWVTGRDL